MILREKRRKEKTRMRMRESLKGEKRKAGSERKKESGVRKMVPAPIERNPTQGMGNNCSKNILVWEKVWREGRERK